MLCNAAGSGHVPSEEEVEAAAATANAKEFIDALPDGTPRTHATS